jgi:hypothetical protein
VVTTFPEKSLHLRADMMCRLSLDALFPGLFVAGDMPDLKCLLAEDTWLFHAEDLDERHDSNPSL